MKLKYALIGCGRISPNHITAAMNNNLDIVGLCDLEINKVNQQIIDYKIGVYTKSYIDY